jgi:hypothetical protein
VFLQLQGSCDGCPSSSATLKGGIERMLTHWVPEVAGMGMLFIITTRRCNGSIVLRAISGINRKKK